MAVLDSIFKAYDIRGTYPDQLDADVARRVGAAFAAFAAAPSILVARDMRPSGEELSAAFAEGANSQGVDVVDLGLASTDLLYYAAGSLDAPGAVFTASHNPAGYNGIKLCLAGAAPVGEESGLVEIKAMTAEGLPTTGEAGSVTRRDLLRDYAEHVRSFVDTSALAPLRIVVDSANGMGGHVAPAVFEGLPFEVTWMYQELDGTFPNHPADPLNPANIVDLRARVLELGADVGLAFDGDADRVFLVDERGIGVSGSLTTALLAKGILAKQPGETVLHNLICSKAVPEVIRESGGTPVRTKVGHSFIKAVMAETGAVFGGEHSAHYYFRDNYRADSGLIAAMIVLEQLSVSGTKLSQLIAPLDRYAASGEVNSTVDDAAATLARVREHFEGLGADVDDTDGLTFDLGDWWFNLRPSNTEPLLRLNLEAADRAACDARTDEVLTLIRSTDTTET
ncbi:MAG: Phosphomannomutase [uncultured Acidimicrobiales bacterium]|uniref:Phosphomannomutase n=1 Tax=uncultured Acidimicrobiales bacterium TaxID=310071 RepID=A0A6J4ILH4_9ACTN|nr:MAG: Phosphomannomutase [uncultured Acidimicrobiales bacterium]